MACRSRLGTFKVILQEAKNKTWVTGARRGPCGVESYLHLVRQAGDPERSPRPDCGVTDRSPHRTLNRRPLAEIREVILGGLLDGMPRTFNRLGVEAFDLTADVLFTTKVNDALWELVAEGRLEHTLEVPILFRLARERKIPPLHRETLGRLESEVGIPRSGGDAQPQEEGEWRALDGRVLG